MKKPNAEHAKAQRPQRSFSGAEASESERLAGLTNQIIVELKAIERLEKVHEAQLLTYLRLSGCKVGLLINFNVPLLRDGRRRVVHGLEE